MKIALKFKTIGLAFALGLCVFACNQEARNQSGMHAEGSMANSELQEESLETKDKVNNFSAWLLGKPEKAKIASKQEWEVVQSVHKLK
ncbi:hypothetical protein [Pontibacter harenae]|uniref:hypothetical protein n=1 Tax=Pontibacter harenae TaxID=2894083 RepID=UPI001E34BC17|nr:hypothetical protein [Pontibacter harenae]MCC9166076.1 hypothetical protein [Pontibacter harenae]